MPRSSIGRSIKINRAGRADRATSPAKGSHSNNFPTPKPRTTKLRQTVIMNTKKTIVGCAAALVLTATSFAANPTTVGVLNPTPNGQTIVDSPNNVGNANFVGQSAMSSLMTSAFANNAGGVINFDSANGWTT